MTLFLGRLECVKDLIASAKSNKYSMLRKLTASDQDVFDVWDNVSHLVELHMSNRKAVQIPGLGLFTFTSSKLEVGHKKYILIQRPVFILTEKLIRTHGLSQTKYHVPGEIPVIQLNFAHISHAMQINKDLTEAAVKEVVNAFSRTISQKRSVELGFTTIGNLVINNGSARMNFLPDFVHHIDRTGKLTKFLIKRPGTSNGILPDYSLILPRIQPGGSIRATSIKPSSSKCHPTIQVRTKEEERTEINEDVPETNPSSPQHTATQPHIASKPQSQLLTEVSPVLTDCSKKREVLVPTLKVQPKSPAIQQISLSPPKTPPAPTPRKQPNIKKASFVKDQRNECSPRSGRFLTLGGKLSRTNLNELLRETPPRRMNSNPEKHRESSSCSNCSENLNDFCYLCFQRQKRNVPVYFTEERNRFEQEEDHLLQTYTLLKDSEALQREQDNKNLKREEARSIAALNLDISQSNKEKKNEERLDGFKRSYVFHGRPVTSSQYVKQADYQLELAKQVNDKKVRLEHSKMEQEMFDRVEQLKLAEDLALQRDQFLRSKKLQCDQYRKALDTQVYIRRCLEERNLERNGERRFSLPRPNVVLPFPTRNSGNDTGLDCSPSEVPASDSNADSLIFGTADPTESQHKERRRRARLLYFDQKKQAQERKEKEAKEELARKQEEEEMLKRTKRELFQETVARNNTNLQLQRDMELHWAAHASSKKMKEMEEQLHNKSLGVLLHDQCDKYARCDQCTRVQNNVGKSNVWSESRYVSGSRLII